MARSVYRRLEVRTEICARWKEILCNIGAVDVREYQITDYARTYRADFSGRQLLARREVRAEP